MSASKTSQTSQTAQTSQNASQSVISEFISPAKQANHDKRLRSMFFEISIIVWATVLYAILSSYFFDNLLAQFAVFANPMVRYIVKLVLFIVLMYVIYIASRRETAETDFSKW
jgi:hypothetical protein